MAYPDPSDAARSRSRPAKPRRPVAVALQYELDGPSLPRVVASGQGHVAEQILEMAFASGVKVREDADLAELLSVVQLDSEIPADALVAVAEILAYIYRANGKLPPRGGQP
ncbi:EscU/YscU/HrcU family type III secretion system export apparatus switch protein [Skermanella pratensis]|uniref:EscU/YscU/HrcU family type III secretion system export apparatus switch protein n=1 Tax=Skermanella pratensis TaxID=2233999 RepID=UPI0013011467|nr:EscU/YscU/HrcU family type III secretion system export apparatus switch protein [Skermanella pratensis]